MAEPFVDKELELYRGLMDEPTEYEDGFSGITVVGAIFIGFVMLPGAIYLGLVAGQTMGPAAEWTTIILFTEIARRSFMTLSRQQVYILFYVAGSLVSTIGGLQLAGGAFAGRIWEAYFVQSPAARGLGIVDDIPRWVVPAPDSPALLQRTFFHPDWLLPIALVLVGQIIGRMNWFGLGYVLFRITADIERLPFPFAAINAQGATALAESTTKAETWRWRMFSIGSMIGLVFGAFYAGIPTLTGVVLQKPLQLIPIPFVDLTRNTERILPATPTGINLNLGLVLAGFVIPFWAVIGGLVQATVSLFLCPALFKFNVLQHWRPGMDTIATSFANSIDFFFSAGMGVAFAVAAIGMWMVGRALLARQRGEHAATASAEPRWTPPPGRGDLPMWLCVGMWVASTIAFIILCLALIPRFPIVFIVFFGFIFTPINSYIDARMIGLTGQYISLPFVKEGVIILSGYKGVDIWFAPIPTFDHGGQAQHFRVVELTGTKITSMIKAELLIIPVSVGCSLLFWQFIWRLAPIPSATYPYAMKMWHLFALQRGLWLTSTVTGTGATLFQKALYFPYVAGGFGFALGSYILLSSFRLPTLLVYGVMRGLGRLPHDMPLEMLGALLSRYYFEKRYGQKRWKQYATVLNAGFACGMGLVGMGTVAVALIAKSVSQLPY